MRNVIALPVEAKESHTMRQIAAFVVVVGLLVAALPAPAQAQGRVLGIAMAGVGAAMLLLDPEQPTQPSVVSRDVLIDEAASFIAGPCGTNPVSCEFRAIVLELQPNLLVSERRGVLVGAIAGAAVGISTATSNGRTIYADQFQPFKERSAGLKYGGAALVIGGALITALWPNPPAAMEDVSIRRTVGGVAVGKTFGF